MDYEKKYGIPGSTRETKMRVNYPIVTALIERKHHGNTEVLIQTRWKPQKDLIYSGTIEIPAGGINLYENVIDALKREVFEETGLKVTKIKPDIESRVYSPQNDDCFAFIPFCCQQQLKSGIPRVGFVFICEVEDKEPTPEISEVKDIRWIKKEKLRKLYLSHPERFFTLHLGVFELYFNSNKIMNQLLSDLQ